MTSEIKGVIFDMDGVIFDSERAVHRCWLKVAEKYGLHDIDAVYQRCIGVNADLCRRNFLEFYGPNIPYDEMLKERRALYFKDYSGKDLPVKPGVPELLSYLKERGLPTALASSTRIAVVRQQIEDAGFLPYFDRIIGGDMVEHSKPDPEIFIKAAEALGLGDEDPASIVVIEDSYNGIRAAHAAGMFPVMVPDMLPPNDEMDEKAGTILGSLLDVICWMKSR